MEGFQSAGLTALATLLAIAVLFLLTKLMGSKQVSQMTMFDYIVGITIGSIAAELATERQDPLRLLVSLVVCGVMSFLISTLTSKSLTARRIITGKPLVLLNQGVLYRENLKRARMDLNEFLTFCRISGYFDLTQIQTAVLEHNGFVSFLPKETQRPATPADLDLRPKQSQIQVPFIMDGVLLSGNVRQAGKEESWVRRTLSRQGYGDAKEVLLALWDGGAQLTIFPCDPQRKGADGAQ